MSTAILWFRQDLRLADNPALAAALDRCEQVIPLYTHAPGESGTWQPGAASNWWLHHSLLALDRSLRDLGSRLVIRVGPALDTLRKLAAETGARQVFWNRLYEPAHIERDKRVKLALREDGLSVESFNAALLFEPWEMSKADRAPYRVFTPFWKSCVRAGLPCALHDAPTQMPAVPAPLSSLNIEDLALLPTLPWDGGLRSTWQVGEQAALENLQRFAQGSMAAYHEERNRPDLQATSRLSPHLHFGEVGPRQVVAACTREGETKGGTVFLSEIGWREFAHHLLYHFPRTTDAPMQERFAAFAWSEPDEILLEAWRQGRTGIPMVDAGMRELWHTGWMHNRVRMIVASFLTKNLLMPWQEGARWFWDTLVDADLANNTQGWQWTAGCGADAAPYFRIFNPVLQGARFDPSGAYVRRWVPELAQVPDERIHQPRKAPAEGSGEGNPLISSSYPLPIVDIKASRERALERYERLQQTRET